MSLVKLFLFYIHFFIHIVWKSDQCYQCNHRRSCCKLQWAIVVCFCCWIDTLIQLRRHKWFINLFIVWTVFSKNNLLILSLSQQRMEVFYLTIKNCLYYMTVFIVSKKIKSLYVSCWIFIYIKFCFLFQTSYSKPILFAATAFRHWYSRKWQR